MFGVLELNSDVFDVANYILIKFTVIFTVLAIWIDIYLLRYLLLCCVLCVVFNPSTLLEPIAKLS